LGQGENGGGERSAHSKQPIELRLYKFLRRSGYSDEAFLRLPYARAIQLIRLEETLEAEEQRQQVMRDARRGYEAYVAHKGALTLEAFNKRGKSGARSKDSLLTPDEYQRFFGYKVDTKPTRTADDDRAAAERTVKMAIAAFRRGGMAKQDMKTFK
jgi:hypothetical protein